MLVVGKVGVDETRSDDVGDASVQVLRHLLRKIRRADVLLAGDNAIMRLDVAIEHFQQRGLPHAIAPQQTDTLAALNLETNII